ncbi:hypothetical protein [Bacillus sp. 1P06AnD]|uniref:mediterrocin family bacteriocin n=1 Tax=Bacillus sp. 1P06AnD TaxID=3132208 RepID=UPI0039A04C4F
MKKVKSVMAALVLAMSVGTVSAHAATDSTDSATLGKSFSNDWSSTRINSSTETFKVGYNTTLINEDYTHTFQKDKSHSAYVKNTGSAQTLKGSAGSYAKAEIQHHSGTVYYSFTR